MNCANSPAAIPVKIEIIADKGVVFLGRADEKTKRDLLKKAHILLVPSVEEGWDRGQRNGKSYRSLQCRWFERLCKTRSGEASLAKRRSFEMVKDIQLGQYSKSD
jgi:hypothetical protein